MHPANVYRIPAELGAEEGARAYDAVLAAGPLDLVLLGIGPDGHTASLFPGHPALRLRAARSLYTTPRSRRRTASA